MTLRWFFAWFGMMALAILNGVLREFVLLQQLADRAAHQLSTVLLLVLFAGYFWLLARVWPLRSAGHAWAVGAMWLVMTLAFEFGLGLAGGLSWPELIEQYNVASGNLWLLIPAFVLVGPYLAFRAGARARA